MVVSGWRCHVSCTTRQLLQRSHYVCVCVRVGAYVCVHVAFAVLPLHTHSTLIDPTASSNKGFDFQHDKRQSQSSAGPAGSIICFAKPTSQSVNQLVTQSVSQSIIQSVSQLASQSTCEPLPCNWILNFIYCLRTVRSARLCSLCICLDNCYCQYTAGLFCFFFYHCLCTGRAQISTTGIHIHTHWLKYTPTGAHTKYLQFNYPKKERMNQNKKATPVRHYMLFCCTSKNTTLGSIFCVLLSSFFLATAAAFHCCLSIK